MKSKRANRKKSGSENGEKRREAKTGNREQKTKKKQEKESEQYDKYRDF